jgi:tRNA threonylcarbamoyladenosine biosynthesis protein TsaB
MLLLAVDTSTPAGSLAVLRDGRVLGVISTWVEETYSSRMFRHLDFLLGEFRLDLKQFEVFAVAAGPGSFTGLRVGLAAVKGWAEVFETPIAAVSGLRAVAVESRASSGVLVPVLDARRGQVYGGIYRRGAAGLERQGDERALAPNEFWDFLRAEIGTEPFTVVTPTPEVLEATLGGSGFADRPIEQVSAVLAPAIGQLGFECARRGKLVDSLELGANYIRRSDAELSWKGK